MAPLLVHRPDTLYRHYFHRPLISVLVFHEFTDFSSACLARIRYTTTSAMPMFDTLITETELAELCVGEDVRVLDCRFELGDADAGRRAFLREHIPGAYYVDLAEDLSDPPNTACGRHPLPPENKLCALFSRLGIDTTTQVVLYDDSGGMFAARGWWMLRYLSHFPSAVLDGGWSSWRDAGRPRDSAVERVSETEFLSRERSDRLVKIEDFDDNAELIDARDPRRFSGEFEPLDQHAGHIPGAKNHFFQQNLTERGFFREPADLKQAFMASLGKLPGDESVHYCGSGVSACHNVLAQMYAGLEEPRLYCGSWSEWCADSGRPRA